MVIKKLANNRLNVSDLLFASFVGMTRLELATTRPPDAYANQLRHIPIAAGDTGFGKPLLRFASAKLHRISEPAKSFATFLMKKCEIEKIYMILFADMRKMS